ncbi:MAG: YcbK family protein [Gemmatimonadota bacterium]
MYHARPSHRLPFRLVHVQPPANPRNTVPPRRRTLRALASLALALPFSPRAWAAAPRSISFYHTHTGERLSVVYFEAGSYVPGALVSLNTLLRDFRTGDVHEIDAGLFDTLHALNLACGDGTYEIISGFRSPHTNAMLHARSNGVATHSLHMQGRAIDIRLAGRDTRKLRDAAIALARGGVGYYAGSDFVHVDTGRFRTW